MKFRVFTLFEYIYKYLIAILIIVATFISIYYYYVTTNKETTYIVGIVYALVIFILGLFATSMTNRISNKLFFAKSRYYELIRLNELFGSHHFSYNEYRKTWDIITFHKAFTGRVEDEIIAKNPLIDVSHFKYKKGYVWLENNFISTFDKCLNIIRDYIKKYAHENNIKNKFGNEHIMVMEFDPIYDFNSWAKNNLKISEEQSAVFNNEFEHMLKHNRCLFLKLRVTDFLYCARSKLLAKKIRGTLDCIMQIYGNRLAEEIDKDKRLDTLIIEIQKLEGVIGDARTQIEGKIDSVQEAIDELHEIIVSISKNDLEKIYEATTDIVSRMETNDD